MNVHTFFLLSLKLPSSQAVLRYRTAIATFTKKTSSKRTRLFCFERAKRAARATKALRALKAF